MKPDSPRCLECGHRFTVDETAAMIACDDDPELCVIDCTECGAHNIVRTEPQGGFNKQPAIVVLRVRDEKPEGAEVFDETVEPGLDVHPVSRGESN